MPRPFQIVLVQPDGFAAARALVPTAQMLCFALRRLGYSASIKTNGFLHDGANIVVGAHLLEPDAASQLPPATVVYNTEPIAARAHALAALLPFAHRFAVWDYSEQNARALIDALPGVRVRTVEPGYLPEFTTTVHRHEKDKDVDVLFYGAPSAHRQAAIDALRLTGLRVEHLTATYVDERDAWLARTRLVLAVHFDPGSPFAIGRVLYPMANRCAVVVERDRNSDVPADLRPGLALCAHEELGAVCRALVADARRRELLAERAFDRISRRDFTATLRAALAGEPALR